MKLALLLIAAVITTVYFRLRSDRARERLAEVDRGARCVACGATDVEIEGDEVRCADCGHCASLSRLRAEKIDPSELDAFMIPRDGD
jgi:hypothetical protein